MPDSDTATMTFSGNDIVLDSSDGGYIFTLTDGTDGTVDIMTNNDSDDYIQISMFKNLKNRKNKVIARVIFNVFSLKTF